MAGSRKTGYKNERSYNSNGSYRTVYTAGSAAPDYQRASGRSAAYDRNRAAGQSSREYGTNRTASQRSAAYDRNRAAGQGSRAYDTGRRNNSYDGQQSAGQRAGSARQAGSGQRAGSARRSDSSRRGNSSRNRSRSEERYSGYAQTAPAYDPVYQPQRRQKPQTKQQRMAAERRKHIALRNQQRALEMNIRSVAFLSALLVVVCLFGGVLVHKNYTVRNSMNRVSDLQNEVSELKQRNNTRETELYSSANLNTIKKDAGKLGMTYAGEDQIIYFTMDNSDYVNDFSAVK